MKIFPSVTSQPLLVGLLLTVSLTLVSPNSMMAQSTNWVADPLTSNVRDTVLAVAVQPDGKFLVAGEFIQIGSTTKRHIARLNADGTLDTAFTAATDDDVHTIALQSDGKILIGGDFRLVNNVQHRSVARLLPTGALDTSFNAGTLDKCRSLAVQTDGSIIVGGIPYLTRLLPSGASDPSFTLTSNLTSGHRIYTLAIQSDGKILAGGLLTASPTVGLVRLNSNGSQDTTFATLFDLPVRSIAIQPDEKILVGGDFQNVNGAPALFLTRLLPTGLTDSAMPNYLGSVGLDVSPEGFLGSVYSIALVPAGGFIAAGPVNFVSGASSINHLTRFGPNGALDTTFDARLRRTVHQVINVPGERLLVGGDFTSIAGVARERLARLAAPTLIGNVSLSSTGASIPETDANFTFDVTLSAAVAVPFTVPLTFSGTATAGKDYTRPATSLRFEPGELTKTITVPLLDDNLIEGNETIIITLSEPADPAVSRLAPFTATYTLQSDELAAQITLNPVGQIAAVGAPVTFTATATGNPISTLEWRRNGIRISGATASPLTLPSVTLASAGNYSMKAIASNTSATTINAPLTIVDQTPVSLPGATTATATLSVKLASPERPTFKWFRNTVPVSDTPNKITGSASPTLIIRNLAITDADTYTCEVTTSAGSLNGAPINLIVYDSVPEVLSVVTPLVIPTAMVSENVNYAMPINTDPLKTPTKFTITGLPSGIKFDSITGRLFGRAIRSGVFDNIQITPSNAKGLGTRVTARMEILPLTLGVAGSYIANITRETTVNANLGGSLALTVTPTGQCSGSLRSAGSTFRFTGALDTSAVGGDPSALITIRRSSPLPSLILDIDFALASSTITGTLKEDGSVPTADVAGHLCLPAPTDRQGYQTVTFDYTSLLNSGDETIPQGTGFLTFTVPASGSVRMTGNLPDGTALTLSSRISSNGNLPIYLPLYRSTGSLLAEISVGNDVNRTVSGSLTWSRNPQALSQRSYQMGFIPIFYTVTGGAYLAPASGVPVMGLPAINNNARLTFLEGLVSSAVVSPDITFSLGTAAAAIFPTFASGNNPNRVALSVNRNTGTFSGQFTLVNALTLTKNLTRVAKFQGVIARDGAASTGGGYFILPKLPDPLTAPSNTTPILSGQVNLLPSP